ncbi:MAG: hypothetical protein AB7E95_08590 [Kiritimatiellales bacterium]
MNKKMTATLIALTGILSALQADLVVTATSITDDFERTAAASADGTLGTTGAWTNEFADSTWGTTSGVVIGNLAANHRALVNKALQIGTGFTLKADVQVNYVNGWAGISFNYQDSNNYYAFRFKSNTGLYTVSKIVNGAAPINIESETNVGTFSSSSAYTLTVTTENGIDYTFDILDSTTQTSVLASTLTMSDTTFSGGYAGLFQTTSGPSRAKFDNFSLVIPEPASLSLMVIGSVLAFSARGVVD